MASNRRYNLAEERVEAFSALIDDRAPNRTSNSLDDKVLKAGLSMDCWCSPLSQACWETRLACNSVINSLSMKMHSPVLIGQEVDYRVEITALTAAVAAVSLVFSGTVNGTTVISGKVLCSFPQASSR